MIQAQQPLFTNDPVGFIKIVSLLVGTVLLPLAGLVVYFLKRGDASALNAFEKDLNGLGSRVKAVEIEQGKLAEQMVSISRAMSADHEAVLGAIQRASEQQMRATHEVEVQVARLDERNNIGDALAKFATSIERLVELVVTRGDR
ncbi:MAG TPA: hypothetical protein VL333_13215 [Candidatus Saccharimonadales bacterium]|jgi:hypothetical protein|nr:hypothetical protein [Candidatus Saccharimonadales bacterium]